MAQLSQYSRDFLRHIFDSLFKTINQATNKLEPLREIRYLSNSVLIAADFYEQFVSVALLKKKIKETVV